MVKGAFTIVCTLAVLCAAFVLFNPTRVLLQETASAGPMQDVVFVSDPVVQQAPPSPTPRPPPPKKSQAGMPPPVAQVLQSGTLIVISKASQQMYVFKDGALWDTSPVSTGKPGKETPTGMFPILQKRVFHRSNIYSNAPMPHMQRLTWGGIAIHAGKLPGYPASHGCIRLPPAFAKALFAETDPASTTVIVTDNPLASEGQAKRLAVAMPMPSPGERGHLLQRPEPKLAELDAPAPMPTATSPASPVAATTSAPPPTNLLAQTQPQPRPVAKGQTIQLAAKSSASEAEAYWSRISARFPELERYEKAIIPAVVYSKQYYRLRVTGPGARDMCTSLKRSGADCFPV
ncbi:L,D-transpeptidase family protein [Citromicrobium bathyomarinum]|uniref:L,D-transpeptidase family protein n=1 Tax=Citromicrobium bathyomarinum TaxID=72174 RepID=UPI00315A6225